MKLVEQKPLGDVENLKKVLLFLISIFFIMCFFYSNEL